MRFVGCWLRPTPSACHTGLSGGFWISVTDRFESLSRWVAGKTRSGGKVFPPLWRSQTAAVRVADCLCLYPGCGSATECGGCFGFVVRRFRRIFGARPWVLGFADSPQNVRWFSLRAQQSCCRSAAFVVDSSGLGVFDLVEPLPSVFVAPRTSILLNLLLLCCRSAGEEIECRPTTGLQSVGGGERQAGA
jgi:hypothetical protein